MILGLPPNENEIATGATLGKYSILRKLAVGGMAELYLARGHGRAGFEKVVVLKRILPSVAEDPVFVQMFLDEARLAATLQHPHIADVYDVDCIDSMYFFTMEYIHGQDARAIRSAAHRRNERVPLAIAVGIVHSIASALDYAHDRMGPNGPLNLVHRDISASNILISYDGAVKLVDFGIAHSASREQTRSGTLKGKVPYMSPEQAQGRRLDRRSDLFSLGTVLYELTVGQRPYRGDSDFAIMEQIVRGEAPPPTSIDPEYPPELEAIVMKLLTRDLSARYQTAEQLLADLEPFQESHQLWMSAKVISRYMRSLFWDNVAAWEIAAREGVSLGDHVTSVSSEYLREENVTPPSQFPVATSADIPTVAGRTVPMFGAGSIVALPEPQPLPRRSRALVIVGSSAVVLIGVALGFVAVSSRSSSDRDATETTVAEPMPQQPQPPAPSPVAKPDPAPPVAAKPVTPVAPPPASEAKPAAVPIGPVPPTTPPPPAVTTPAPTPPPTTKPPATPTTTKPVVKKPPAPIKPKPEEETWDVNSPTLPPRR